MPGITLNNNEVISALSNQILSIQTYSDNISEMYGGVLGISKADAGMYGDKKVYIATNTLTSTDWANDAEAANLLALNRPAAPDVQVITLDTFRKVFVQCSRPLSISKSLTMRLSSRTTLRTSTDSTSSPARIFTT